jgi:hypothetical protein
LLLLLVGWADLDLDVVVVADVVRFLVKLGSVSFSPTNG